jgi:hypothetical protein
LYSAGNWAFRYINQNYLESSETCCRTRMKKISWTDRLKNEIFHTVKKKSYTQ